MVKPAAFLWPPPLCSLANSVTSIKGLRVRKLPLMIPGAVWVKTKTALSAAWSNPLRKLEMPETASSSTLQSWMSSNVSAVTIMPVLGSSCSRSSAFPHNRKVLNGRCCSACLAIVDKFAPLATSLEATDTALAVVARLVRLPVSVMSPVSRQVAMVWSTALALSSKW